ncbi:MAG: hypothetical protein AAGG07_14700 [Planctomycetota bacterium]
MIVEERLRHIRGLGEALLAIDTAHGIDDDLLEAIGRTIKEDAEALQEQLVRDRVVAAMIMEREG